jgi:hypothetical protein
MLRNLCRGLALVLVSAVGCNDVTMELRPTPAAPIAGKSGDGTVGDAGEPPFSAGGMAAGRGGSGGAFGGMGNAGSANDGGDGNHGAVGGCGPTGCFPEVDCFPLEGDCKICKDNHDCEGERDKPYCQPYTHHCVACLTCPRGQSCDNHCPRDRSLCDTTTNTCREPCLEIDGGSPDVCSPSEFCDDYRGVCVDCNTSNPDCRNNPKGSVCFQQVCVECFTKVDGYSMSCRDPSRPICHVADLTCYPCKNDGECGADPWRCDEAEGRCVSQSPPQP